jgi:hypothetical protein
MYQEAAPLPHEEPLHHPEEFEDPETMGELCIADAQSLRDLMSRMSVEETSPMSPETRKRNYKDDQFDVSWVVRLMTHADQAGYFGDRDYLKEKNDKTELPLDERALGIYRISLDDKGHPVRRLYAGVDPENKKFISTPKNSPNLEFYADAQALAEMRIRLQDAAALLRSGKKRRILPGLL